MAQIADLLPEGTVLITGAVRAPEAAPGERVSRAYNSVYVIDHDGSILDLRQGASGAVRRVPAVSGLCSSVWGCMQLTKVSGGFIAGDRRRAMTVPRAPRFLPLICYEIIFPGEAVPRRTAPGVAGQRHQRRVVRHQLRPLSAFPAVPRARDRARPADGARGEQRHFRGDRSARAHYTFVAARRRRRARCPAAASASSRPCLRAGDGSAGAMLAIGCAWCCAGGSASALIVTACG